MKKWILSIFALAALPGTAFFAPDITGTWQGRLPLKPTELRILIKISKAEPSGLKAVLYSIDQGGQGTAGAVSLQGTTVKIALPSIEVNYEGSLDAAGSNLTGTFTQRGQPLPVSLKHVGEAEAWAIPEPPARLKPMAADANPAFEVAVIKPNTSGAAGRRNGSPGPRQFSMQNYSVTAMIMLCYGVHPRQIVGGPAWMETEKYDITAKADGEGQPNRDQWMIMVQKLLADRFGLAFHKENKEMPVYAITIGKNGPKLIPSADPNGGASMLFNGGSLPARNASMPDFAAAMQRAVLDRPVVDQTGLQGKFDFSLVWTPDENQFLTMGGGRPRPPADDPNAPPDLATAFQDQLGLKLIATKANVEVIVVDKVSKPSEN